MKKKVKREKRKEFRPPFRVLQSSWAYAQENRRIDRAEFYIQPEKDLPF